jgi:hypothetical protein
MQTQNFTFPQLTSSDLRLVNAITLLFDQRQELINFFSPLKYNVGLGAIFYEILYNKLA